MQNYSASKSYGFDGSIAPFSIGQFSDALRDHILVSECSGEIAVLADVRGGEV